MKWLKRLTAIATMVAVLCVTCVTAQAHEVPDMSRTGSITVSMTYDKKAVPGGTVTLYRVGDVVSDDGDYVFVLGSDYAASNVSIDDLQSADAARALLEWAEDHDLGGTTTRVSDRGLAVFDDVQVGLYVMAQHDPADGYYAIDPFLVGMPLTEDGSYVYDIDASPKVELATKPLPNTPNTGEAELPVVPLLVGGVIVCVAAAGLCLRKKGTDSSRES